MTSQDEIRVLQRIAQAVERLHDTPPENEIKSADAYVWEAARNALTPVPDPRALDLSLLLGIDAQRDRLLGNTLQFARGFPANHALLWGARGMGKSALIKAVHREASRQLPHGLVLVEVRREDIPSLHRLIDLLRGWVIRRFVLFCEDISFDESGRFYSTLKSALEGGVRGAPDHILMYATSNLRHRPLPDEREKHPAGHHGEVPEEKIPLADRFGLSLGFAPCSLEMYLSIAENYAKHYRFDISSEDLRQQAFYWAGARGARSGRVAWQFIQDLAGKMGKRL